MPCTCLTFYHYLTSVILPEDYLIFACVFVAVLENLRVCTFADFVCLQENESKLQKPTKIRNYIFLIIVKFSNIVINSSLNKGFYFQFLIYS